MTKSITRRLGMGGRSTGRGWRLRTLLAPLCLALGLHVASAATTATTKAATLETEPFFQHGDWFGSAYAYENGQFSHCAVSAQYQSGISLAIGLLDDGTLSLVLGHDRWNLGHGERYQVSLSVDSRARRTIEATGNGSLLLVPIGGDDRLYNALRQGHRLRVFAARETLTFSLRGTYVVLQKLRDCLWQHTVTAQSRNPFRGGSPFDGQASLANPFTPPAGSAPESTAENRPGPKQDWLLFDTAELRAMLASTGATSPIILPAERRELDGRVYFYQEWAVTLDPFVYGYVIYFPYPLGDPGEALTQFANGVLGNCEGAKAMATDRLVEVDAIVLGRAVLGCDTSDARAASYVTAVFGAEGTLFFTHQGSDDGAERAQSVDEGLRRHVVGQ